MYSDFYWQYVVLAAPMDGTDGSTTFTDLKGHIITASGNTHIETDQSKYGGASGYFDGVGDYLVCDGVTPIGVEDFTVELWARAGSWPATDVKILLHWVNIQGINLELTTTGAIGLYSYSPSGYISGGSFTTDTWHHIAITRKASTFKLWLDGVLISTLVNTTSFNSAPLYIGRGPEVTSRDWVGYIDDIRITRGIARYTDSFTPPLAISRELILIETEQLYGDVATAKTVIEQTYCLKLGALFSQPYGDVGTVRQGSTQWYGDASLIRSAMVAVYGPAIRTSATINHIYSLPDPVLVSAWQSYAISGSSLRSYIYQAFDLTATDLVRNFATNPYAILGDNGQVLTYTTSVTAGGVTIDPSGISISGSLNEYCLSCDLELATQADYLACAVGVDLEVTINTEAYRFFVEGRGRSREHGATGYTVHGLSKTALLDAPYAEPVSVELTGMASGIVAALATGYALQWDTIDWLIPENTLLPADKTPLEVIREIAHAAGAIIQTAPDGTLIVQANYIHAVPRWGTATPDYLLSDSLDFFTDSAEYEHRDGYNKFLISDQLTTNDTVRLEEETVTDTTKLIRGYKTPWEETFTLRHTGGSWVTIEPLGVETIDKIEVIEFVAGTGHTQYPIYGITDMAWLQNNLGVVTHSEDGSLESSVPEESLLSITYQTQCLKWKVTNPQSEKVQFVAEEPAI